MSQPGGAPQYDREGLAGLTRDTRELGAAFARMKEYAGAGNSTPTAFGRIGGQTRVGEVFEQTRHMLAESVGRAGQHSDELAHNVDASAHEMESRDDASGQRLHDTSGGM